MGLIDLCPSTTTTLFNHETIRRPLHYLLYSAELDHCRRLETFDYPRETLPLDAQWST